MHLAFLSTLLWLALVQGAALLPGFNATSKTCSMVLNPEHNFNIRCGWPGPLVPGRIATLGLPSTTTNLYKFWIDCLCLSVIQQELAEHGDRASTSGR